MSTPNFFCMKCGGLCSAITVKFGVVNHHTIRCKRCNTTRVEVVVLATEKQVLKGAIERLMDKVVEGQGNDRVRDVISRLEIVLNNGIQKKSLFRRKQDMEELQELRRINKEAWDEY